MGELDPRTQTQYDAVKSWKAANHRGTIILPTGFGKSYIGVVTAGEQIRKGLIKSCMVVVPSTALVDQWKEEFAKWGYSLEGIDVMCLQSAYKMNEHRDLLIVDEIHTALSPQYRNVFFNIKHNQIMGLTATKPHNEEYYKYMQLLCPVVFTKTLTDALEIGAISNYMTYNLEISLNRKDRGRYRVFDSMLKKAQMELSLIKRGNIEFKELTIFDIAKKFSTYKNPTKELKNLVYHSKQFWNAMSMRKWVCYGAESKIPATIKIIKKFTNRKWIIFNKSIKFAEQLEVAMKEEGFRCQVYHSKMKKTDREKVLKDFDESKFHYLIAVDALNAGLNIPDIDSAICVSGVSTELTNVQQLGRIVRAREGKKALFINLYCKDTVEETWVRSKTKTLKNCLWITSESQIYEQNTQKEES